MVLPLLFLTGIEGGDPVRFAKILGFMYVTGIAIAATRLGFLKLKEAMLLGYIVFNVAWTGFGTAQSESLIYIFAALFSTFIVVNGDDKIYKTILKCLMYGGIPVAILGYLQCFNYDPVFNTYADRVVRELPRSFFGQETVAGPWYAICAISSLFIGSWPFVALYSLLVILTKSSFSYLSFAAGLWIYGYWLLKRKTFIIASLCLSALFFLAVIALYNTDLMHDQGRRAILTGAIEGMFENYQLSEPLVQERSKYLIWSFGFGLGTWKAIYPVFFQPDWTRRMHGLFLQAHNEYLQILFELGIVGFILFFWNLADFFKGMLKLSSKRYVMGIGAIFIVFTVDSIGSFPMHLMPHGVLMMWAYFLITRHDKVKVT